MTRRGLLVAVVALALASCKASAPADGPAPLAYDRDTCDDCGMTISEAPFAAQVLTPAGKRYHFDDFGCAVNWVNHQTFRDDPQLKIWAADGKGGWVDGKTAHFAEGPTSPMGYNLALAASGLDFKAVQAKVAERERHDKETP